ncbi:MAG: type 1 glutamine amidotransferase domain-containing protein [Chthoniobacterales bacterium]
MKALFLAALVWVGVAGLAGAQPKVLMVLSNHGELGDTGKDTGFYLSEAAHPFEVFRDSGFDVVLASPEGGFAPVDPKSLELEDPGNAAFWKEFGAEEDGVKGVKDTMGLAAAKVGDYDAIFLAGGHGTMWDFPDSESVKSAVAGVYDSGGLVAAVCHGPAALVNVKLKDGEMLVKGKRVAAFTNAEEAAVELTDAMPFLLQDRLEEAGATVETGENFSEKVVTDERLITGQNPASARATAMAVTKAILARQE